MEKNTVSLHLKDVPSNKQGFVDNPLFVEKHGLPRVIVHFHKSWREGRMN